MIHGDFYGKFPASTSDLPSYVTAQLLQKASPGERLCFPGDAIVEGLSVVVAMVVTVVPMMPMVSMVASVHGRRHRATVVVPVVMVVAGAETY